MRKIISLFLVMLIFVISLPTTFAAYKDTNDKSVLLISGLGLMNGYDDGCFLPDNYITRAEFAQIISNINKIESNTDKEWQDMFFIDTDTEMGLKTEYAEEKKPVFDDVDTGHWAYNTVMTVYSLGYMEGISENKFAPDESLTAPQIYKILSVMLGYRVKAVIKGGYPSGYISVANEIGLSDGISNTGKVSRAEVARILENALDAKMLYLSSVGDKETYETYEDKTFLTEILGINKAQGQMTGNGITDLSGKVSGRKDEVVVNGVRVSIDENSQYIRDFIGRAVEIYYKEDKVSGINQALYCTLNGKDEALSFEATDFSGTDIKTISYKENGKIKTVNIKRGAPLIKNGMLIDSPSVNELYVNKGTYTLIKGPGSSAYDIIVLESYVSFYVDSTDSVDKKVYSKSTLISDKCIDFSDESKSYLIYDENGEITSFDSISKGVVLSVSESEEMLKVYISKKTVASVTIKEKNIKDDDIVITAGSASYKVSKDFIDLKGDIIEVGKNYTLYIDKFGEVVNAKSETDSEISVAILVDFKNFGSIDDDYQIKYFLESGTMKVSDVAEKITYIGLDGIEIQNKKITSKEAKELSEYDELFRYKLNENKEICYIELAQNQKYYGNPDNRLLRLEVAEGLNPEDESDGTYNYDYLAKTGINGKVVTNNDTTVVFLRPMNFSDENMFKMSKVSNELENEKSNKSAQLLAYTIEGDSRYANYLLVRNKKTSTFSPTNDSYAIIKGIKKGLNLKGEPMNIITVYESGSTTPTEIYCTDEVINDVRDMWGRKHSDYDPATDSWIPDSQKYKLEVGDIIRYMANDDKSVESIHITFDENAVNPHSKGQGNLAGSYGYFDSTVTDDKGGLEQVHYVTSNPYSVTANISYDDYDDSRNQPLTPGSHFQKNPLDWGVGGRRNMLVYPILSTRNTVRVTTKDLSVEDYVFEEPDIDINNYIEETYRRGSIILYVIKGNDVNPTSIQVSDLKTYEMAGNDCDRIYMVTRSGEPLVFMAIRGKTAK